jgi:segregation and condensation protein B
VSDENLEGQPDAPAAPDAPDAAAAAVAAGAAVDHGEPAPGEAGRDPGALKQILEALIFVHRGILPPKTVREVLGEEFSADEIAAGFAALKEDYERRGGALVLAEVAGGYQFGTRDELAPWIQKLDFYEHHRHLSRPTLETLAIIAYKQPVTRAEIEAIRGVSVERIVRTLIERKLVRILGHKDVPGKPMVLGTSREFLELFGLNSLADLPPLKDFIEPPPEGGVDEELPAPPETAEPAGAEGAEGGEATAGAEPPAGEQNDDTDERRDAAGPQAPREATEAASGDGPDVSGGS